MFTLNYKSNYCIDELKYITLYNSKNVQFLLCIMCMKKIKYTYKK